MLIKLYENDCNFDIKKNLFQKPKTFLKLSKISILSQAFFAIQSIETNYKISFHYDGKVCKIHQNKIRYEYHIQIRKLFYQLVSKFMET